jgi:hypothetical protein
MPALVAGISLMEALRETHGMAGTSPAMTKEMSRFAASGMTKQHLRRLRHRGFYALTKSNGEIS